MIRKSRRGMTLIELMLAVGILAIVAVATGYATVAAAKSYAFTTKMQNDEYNARLALLAITRELHRGLAEPEEGVAAEPLKIYSDPGRFTLEMEPANGETVTYTFSGGELTRTGNSPVTFVPVELESFSVDVDNLDDPRRVKISVKCVNGMKLETVVALYRVPSAE